MNIIINLPNSIEEILFSLPLIAKLKREIPTSFITVFIEKQFEIIPKLSQNIDDIILVVEKSNKSENKEHKSIFLHMKRLKSEIFIDLNGSKLITLYAFLLRIKLRVGEARSISQKIYLNKLLNQKRSIVQMHEIEYTMNLLSKLNLEINWQDRKSLNFSLLKNKNWKSFCEIDEKNNQEIVDFSMKNFFVLEEILKTNEIILVHLVKKIDGISLGINQYSKLIISLISFLEKKDHKKGFKILLVLDISVKEHLNLLFDLLKKEIPQKKIELLQKYMVFSILNKNCDTSNIIQIVNSGSLIISSHGDISLLGQFLEKKCVTIYSPIKNYSTLKIGPIDRSEFNIKIIVPNSVCGENSSCIREECPYYDCISNLDIDEIINKVDELL